MSYIYIYIYIYVTSAPCMYTWPRVDQVWDRQAYHSVVIEFIILQWRHNERDGVSNHRRLDFLLNPLFKLRSKTTSKLRVTGLSEGNPTATGGFPSQRANNAENVSIWSRHHDAFRWWDFKGVAHEGLCVSSGPRMIDTAEINAYGKHAPKL